MSDTESDLRRALNACDEALRSAVALKNEIQAERDRFRDLLQRLAEWDHMQSAGDGPYWLGEIAAAFDDTAPASPAPSGEERRAAR